MNEARMELDANIANKVKGTNISTSSRYRILENTKVKRLEDFK